MGMVCTLKTDLARIVARPYPNTAQTVLDKSIQVLVLVQGPVDDRKEVDS